MVSLIYRLPRLLDTIGHNSNLFKPTHVQRERSFVAVCSTSLVFTSPARCGQVPTTFGHALEFGSLVAFSTNLQSFANDSLCDVHPYSPWALQGENISFPQVVAGGAS